MRSEPLQGRLVAPDLKRGRKVASVENLRARVAIWIAAVKNAASSNLLEAAMPLRLLTLVFLLCLVGCSQSAPPPDAGPAVPAATGFELDDDNRVHIRFTEFKVEGGDRLEVTTAIVNATREYMKRVESHGRPAAAKWMLSQLNGKNLADFVKDFGPESKYGP